MSVQDDTGLVRASVEDGYRILTLHRPDRLNAFNVPLHKALKAALDAAEADTSCRAIVLTGAGRGFCAGQDLADPSIGAAGTAADEIEGVLDRWYNPLVRRLRTMPLPVVAAVNGIAAGGGANLALACDIVVAARSAKFLQAFAKIGLVPDVGGTWTLQRVVGSARARALAMLAEPVDAETAERWGMIWKTVDDAHLMAEATAIAKRLAALPNGALIATKRALDFAETATLDAALDHERDVQQHLAASHDFREGVTAFLEKRAPKFADRS